ncbi:3-hydroxyisobutyryl-CoA hydrolase-like protein 1, mitochondrial [Salvia miltiorrhiza]|uniref:3-hydroxyisobutyryl-CoA hydrolase-like protein 1, mitochondrial n=1 Tax=Salvia miltiorrhiza TaxID=226208 RepID=UPI0025ABD1E2|nr:3-hydroxyisobutyryl-CoA hydrolase-like protein 1, mitochondrial [Salvia miltiorrhiza]
MVICKPALFGHRCWSVKKHRTYSYRCLNNRFNDLLVVEKNGGSRTALINSPSSLNAINNSMVVKLQKMYREWEDDPDVGFVILKGRGRAFSAGGDLRSIFNMMKQGKLEECKQFFRNAYGLIHMIATYSKPHVAILNGITMGGGAGISVLGTFRVATQQTVFATPETLIGFHPDGAASFYLSRLPYHLGEYLGLIGDTLNGAEMLSCGLATHYTHSTNLPLVDKVVANLVTASADPSPIATCLQKFQDSVLHHHTSLFHRLQIIDTCFRHNTIEEIVQSLEDEAARENDAWCRSTIKKLKGIAPLSLKVALASIRLGRSQTLEQCLVREYTMTVQALSKQISTDFYEGIRAKLVDKDYSPKWDPPRLEQVSQDMVDRYFSPLSPFEPQLELPKHENTVS